MSNLTVVEDRAASVAQALSDWISEWREDGAIVSLVLNGYVEVEWPPDGAPRDSLRFYSKKPYRDGDPACCPFCSHSMP